MTGVMERLENNAMFYKDITQWLRNRTFTTLFFGLLVIAEIISLIVILNSDEIAQPGIYMYYSLSAVLMAYGVIIGLMGKQRTQLEFRSGTFDLFELCGMTEQQMVNGKLVSMYYEFAFGFFCLVPFMFFSYYLGGIDFVEMVAGIILSWLIIIPLYIINLTGGLTGRRQPVALIGVLIAWVLKCAMLFFFVIPVALGWRFIARLLADCFRSILAGELGSIIGFAMVALFYFVTVSIMHTICYEQICPPVPMEEDEA